MGSFSIWHWIVVLLVILIVFGAGKLPRVATDLAQGIKNFKKGLSDPPKEGTPDPNSARASGEPKAVSNGGSTGPMNGDTVSTKDRTA